MTRALQTQLSYVLVAFGLFSGCNCKGGSGTTGAGSAAGSGGPTAATSSGSTGSTTATNGGTTSGTGTNATGSSTGSIYGSQTTPSGPVTLGDGGGFGSGVVNVDGGVTLGSAANFSSAFAYLANSGQAPGSSFVSRVNTVTGQEEARYPTVLPLDNGGTKLCTPGSSTSCLVDVGATYYDNAPSRTVVDLNGGVFVANRGQCNWNVCTADNANVSYFAGNPDPALFSPQVGGADQVMTGAVQGSVTYIANRVDHPEQCAPRCQNRLGWNTVDGGPAIFSSGYTLPGVGSIPASEVLMPGPGAGNATTLAQYAPDLVAHPCQDNGPHDPTDVTDPTNYDDCARFTIPVGAPNGYDLKIQNKYTDRFAPRGLAISKNCGVLNGAPACDVYVGLTEPGGESAQYVHLSYADNFQPTNTVDTTGTNYFAYGAAIGCDGYLWTGHGNYIAGINTNPGATQDTVVSWSYSDDAGIHEMTTIQDPTGYCNAYGTAVDLQQHFWFGSDGPPGVCAFDYGTFLSQTNLHDGSLDYDAGMQIINGLFTRRKFDNELAGNGFGGIVVDKSGIAYSVFTGNPGAVAVNYAGTGAGCGVDGGTSTDSNCLWLQNSGFTTHVGYSHGVDLDQDGNPVVSELGYSGISFEGGGGGSPIGAGVIGLSQFDGGPLAIYQNSDMSYGTMVQGNDAGNDVLYTYSDFTGYALRNITQPAGLFEEIFEGCPANSIVSWNQLLYSASIPAGSSISFQLDSANDPAAFTNQSTSGPQIIGTWTCSSTTTCPSPATLTGLGSTNYVRVTANLEGPACSLTGTGPILNSVQLAYSCVPEITQ